MTEGPSSLLCNVNFCKELLRFAKYANLTYKLQTPFSQLQNGQNAKFQCLSDAEFPKFSKNGLTFYHNPYLLGVIVKKQWAHFFGDTLYI